MVPHYLAPRILTDILSWDVTVLDNASILAIARHYQVLDDGLTLDPNCQGVFLESHSLTSHHSSSKTIFHTRFCQQKDTIGI